jgi:hypothetical protein
VPISVCIPILPALMALICLVSYSVEYKDDFEVAKL